MPRAFTDDEERRIRARLLEAGRQALQRTGFRRTAVEDLTRAVGISKGAFYRFFDSKEALWITLLREGEADARARVHAALADRGPGRLRRVLDVLFLTVQASPTLRVLADPDELAWITRVVSPELLAEARADDDRFFEGVWQVLIADGDLADDVPVEVLVGLPHVALALASGTTAEAVRTLVIEALALRLTPIEADGRS